MASPMTYTQFIKALRDEGQRVVEVKTNGKSPSSHNRNHIGAWGPVHGVMMHHTVTKGTASTVEICRKGYAGLPGPLCHGVIAKDGTVHVVGYGRANHAGSGDDDVLRAVINETSLPRANEANTDGNRHFYGFECENLGDGKDPWPDVQVEAMEAVAAAICRHHKWKPASVIGHKEWQPGKIDPRDVSMDGLRRRIGERLAGKPKSPATATYTVRDGDTLWSIATTKLGAGKRYTEIAKLNGLRDADKLTPGQKLKLPKK
ncbi:N-acetylmuramoyl-L-alanine amidase [Streptomyces sp. NPDC050428]|uniref:LysM peptidoglycan-binding domain-containing protein n=1 Tax=Streptomyces sp. NPDC050428 TaxID=3155757 RepID=UPI00341E7EDC